MELSTNGKYKVEFDTFDQRYHVMQKSYTGIFRTKKKLKPDVWNRVKSVIKDIDKCISYVLNKENKKCTIKKC